MFSLAGKMALVTGASGGIGALRHGFTETGPLLNAVEKVTREARTT